MSETQAQAVYFPICGRREAFNKELVIPRNSTERLKLPGIRRADAAIIRRAQPYQNGKRALDLHCYWVLATLSSEDKHRTLLRVWALPQGAVVYVDQPRDCEITRRPDTVRAYALEVGAEIHRVYVRKTGPHPHVHMEPHITAEPALTERVPLRGWLNTIRGATYGLLKSFSPPPEAALAEIGVTEIFDLT